MKITKERVLSTINYIKQNPNFYFPFKIMCLDFDEHHEVYPSPAKELHCFDYRHLLKIGSLIGQFFI
jgi:hypothetical protein